MLSEEIPCDDVLLVKSHMSENKVHDCKRVVNTRSWERRASSDSEVKQGFSKELANPSHFRVRDRPKVSYETVHEWLVISSPSRQNLGKTASLSHLPKREGARPGLEKARGWPLKTTT